jgi:hypothetical protein
MLQKRVNCLKQKSGRGKKSKTEGMAKMKGKRAAEY